MAHNPIRNLGTYAHPKGSGKKKATGEGSPADRKADAQGMKRTGMTAKQWESSAMDKKQDRSRKK